MKKQCCSHRPHTGKQEIFGSGITIDTGRNPLTGESTAKILIPGPKPLAVSIIYSPDDRTVNITLGADDNKEPILSHMVRMDGLLLRVVPYSSENETSPDIPDSKY